MAKRDYRQYVSKTKSSIKRPRACQLTMISRFLCKCSLTSASHWGPILAVAAAAVLHKLNSCCLVQTALDWGKNVSTYAADFSLLKHHPPCPFSFSVTTHLFAWMMYSHMKSLLGTAVFRIEEGCPGVFVCSLFHLLFHNPLIFPSTWRNISVWEVTLNVLGQTMWWKQNVMRRGRL